MENADEIHLNEDEVDEVKTKTRIGKDVLTTYLTCIYIIQLFAAQVPEEDRIWFEALPKEVQISIINRPRLYNAFRELAGHKMMVLDETDDHAILVSTWVDCKTLPEEHRNVSGRNAKEIARKLGIELAGTNEIIRVIDKEGINYRERTTHAQWLWAKPDNGNYADHMWAILYINERHRRFEQVHCDTRHDTRDPMSFFAKIKVPKHPLYDRIKAGLNTNLEAEASVPEQ